MTNTEKLKILKQGKKLFVEHPEYWKMMQKNMDFKEVYKDL